MKLRRIIQFLIGCIIGIITAKIGLTVTDFMFWFIIVVVNLIVAVIVAIIPENQD